MTKKFFLTFLLLLTLISSAQAEILEVKSMASVESLIDPETLVVFDIDNTLILPAQSLGSDPWFLHTLKTFISNGDPNDVALKKTIALWQQVNLVTRVLPVERGTPYFIHSIQESHIKTIALTSRSSDFAPTTERQLAQVRIDFSKNPVGELNDFEIAPGIRYRRGVVSVSGQDKGNSLVLLMQYFKVAPSKVVFIDDQLRNVQSVDKALTNRVPNYSIRYGFLDEKVRLFDSRVTDLEGAFFGGNGVLISDKRAQSLLLNPTLGQDLSQDRN